MAKPFLHEHHEFKDLLQIVSEKEAIPEFLVGKDYWIMHCLYGLQGLGLDFELKGGTSLSKGFKLIHRFSEDIDIRINPPKEQSIPIGKNQTKPAQCKKRLEFYDWLSDEIKIPGITETQRDTQFDDSKYWSGGVRLIYPSQFLHLSGIKEGILLEVGFDNVTPNIPTDISSWAFDFAFEKVLLKDNRARGIKCYHPAYTLVEKLQAISTKYRKYMEGINLPPNFMRHYYDLYCLLEDEEVQKSIGSEAYQEHKEKRFPKADNKCIAANEAFIISNSAIRETMKEAYQASASLYYKGQPDFEVILECINKHKNHL